jgi:hypothetical protein
MSLSLNFQHATAPTRSTFLPVGTVSQGSCLFTPCLATIANTGFQGNFAVVAREYLDKATKVEGKSRYEVDGHTFNFLNRGGYSESAYHGDCIVFATLVFAGGTKRCAEWRADGRQRLHQFVQALHSQPRASCSCFCAAPHTASNPAVRSLHFRPCTPNTRGSFVWLGLAWSWARDI